MGYGLVCCRRDSRKWFRCLVGLETLTATKEALKEAKSQTREAKEQTKIAREAVTESKRIGEADIRAYLHIRKASVKMEPHDGVGYGTSPKVTVEVFNSGKSPARAFRWNMRTVYEYEGSQCDIRGNTGVAPLNWGENVPHEQALTTTHKFLPSFLNEEDHAALHAGKLRMFARITTVFLDTFDQEVIEDYNFVVFFPAPLIGMDFDLAPFPATIDDIAKQAELNRQWQRQSSQQIDD